MRRKERKYEDYAYVLDYLESGHIFERKPKFEREPIVQALGEKYFLLLELVAIRNVSINIREKLYIGPETKVKIKYVKGLIPFEKLTGQAKAELEPVVEEIVNSNPEKFVEFFNQSFPITKRLHQLELLPGVGKKIMWNILEERKKKEFSSFEDIAARTRLKNPKQAIIKRILEEIKGHEKYRLFVG